MYTQYMNMSNITTGYTTHNAAMSAAHAPMNQYIISLTTIPPYGITTYLCMGTYTHAYETYVYRTGPNPTLPYLLTGHSP